MPDITDNPARSRYEMSVDGLVAFVEYERRGDALVLVHTEVPQGLEGRGVGSRLARAVLDTARADGAKVVPRCEFIAGYIERYPEYRDLVLRDGAQG